MKFLTSIDLIKNELQNAVIQNLAADPANPKEGQIYFNSVEHTLYQYKGADGGWQPVGTEYTLPTASTTQLGGIKVGAGLQISDQGTLSTTGGGVADSVEWSGVLDTPTTLEGYGIVDAKIENGVITLGNETIKPVEDFIITVTSTDGINYTCDKTSAEINEAYEAGKNLLCVAEGGQGYLTIANDNIYEFYFNNVTDAIATTRASVPRILYLINIEINCNTEPPIVSYNEDIILGNKSVGMPDYIKAQFRNTIGAGTSDFSGSYNDLTDTPTVDTDMSATSTNAVQNKVIKAYVDNIVAASQGIVYKGVINSSADIPTTYDIGWLYMVATAGTYVGQKCEVGDLLIAVAKRTGTGNQNSDWDVIQTNIDGAITEITGDAPISVTGTGASREVSLDNSGVTTGGYGDTTAQTPAFGATFKVPSFTVDQYGRLTAAGEHFVTIPEALVTNTNNGLMRSADYQKLNSLDTKVTTLETNVSTLQDSAVTRGIGTLTAGQTTVSLDVGAGKTLTGVLFRNETTNEGVVCDWTHNTATNKLIVTISAAVAYDIMIIYTYM